MGQCIADRRGGVGGAGRAQRRQILARGDLPAGDVFDEDRRSQMLGHGIEGPVPGCDGDVEDLACGGAQRRARSRRVESRGQSAGGVGSRTDRLADLLGQAADERGDEILSVAAHGGEEGIVGQRGERGDGHVHGDSVPGVPGSESVGEGQAGGGPGAREVLLSGHRLRDIVGQIEQVRAPTSLATPPRVEGAS